MMMAPGTSHTFPVNPRMDPVASAVRLAVQEALHILSSSEDGGPHHLHAAVLRRYLGETETQAPAEEQEEFAWDSLFHHSQMSGRQAEPRLAGPCCLMASWRSCGPASSWRAQLTKPSWC